MQAYTDIRAAHQPHPTPLTLVLILVCFSMWFLVHCAFLEAKNRAGNAKAKSIWCHYYDPTFFRRMFEFYQIGRTQTRQITNHFKPLRD